MQEMTEYRYGGARALVLLHEQEMRKFLDVWKRAKAAGVSLPETDDPDYASIETLLLHVLLCARSYMMWMCRMLGEPDPEIRPGPDADTVAAEADSFVEHLLERWRVPLRDVHPDRFYKPAYLSAWDVEYCIDAMLEHAVMHPFRHRFQLERLMETSK